MNSSDYKAAYAKWLASLSPAERAEVERRGVGKPHDDGGKVFSPDTSEVPEQSDTGPSAPDVAEIRDYVRELIRDGRVFILLRVLDELGISTGKAEVIRPALDLILKARAGEVRLEAECVALALGLFAHEGITYTEIGDRWSRSRQVIQSRVKKICVALGIETTQCSKSIASREVYRKRNHRHAKKTLAPVIPFPAQAKPSTDTKVA